MLPLDGRKLFPINHGKSSEETFLQVRWLHLFSEPVMRTKKYLSVKGCFLDNTPFYVHSFTKEVIGSEIIAFLFRLG